MISKKKFGQVGLTSLSAECTRCRVEHDITYPVDREGKSGTLCGHCATILWHASVRHIYVPSGTKDMPVEELAARTRKQEQDYFATMPPCPGCSRHAWERFVEDIQYPPDCRNCGQKFDSGVFRENTGKRKNETVYWYDPS